MSKCKISMLDITWGPKISVGEHMDRLTAITVATELTLVGYRRTSRAYCTVARIDREDWLDVIASNILCPKADLYDAKEGGVSAMWYDYYIRVYSKDKQTVHPDVMRYMENYR